MNNTAEHKRLAEITDDRGGWRSWGPYLSDRAWGTVREDYSEDGSAWSYFPHDHARSRTYRWGEDGIAGWSDRYQLLCLAPAFWNRQDPILKERLFGLTPLDANHGEDVKEYYFHLDATPTHSYTRFLYKYPQLEYPYEQLAEENRNREGEGPEYELLDTGIFDEDRYFDIFIEHARNTPDDLVVRIEAFNRGPDAAPLDIIPHLWYRNVWTWSHEPHRQPRITETKASKGALCLAADNSDSHLPRDLPVKYALGPQWLYAPSGGEVLFTDNETNAERVFGNRSKSKHVKDAFHRYLIDGEKGVTHPSQGTKAALVYRFDAVPPGGSVSVCLRLSSRPLSGDALKDVDKIIETRRREADEFYASIHPAGATDEEKLIQRQALAGLIWTKQSYIFNVHVWLEGDFPEVPPPPGRENIRNSRWRHVTTMRVLTMPDKWEYPWFAAWDLAFQTVAFAMVDPQFAKDQLWYLLFDQFQHPNGQLPAYEWEYSDLNPPVHAWAVWRVYNMDRLQNGRADRDFLERCFHKLLINFAWWVNKVDKQGQNIFEGGFLGLDNITVFDRSETLDDGAVLEQSDATGWMGAFCLALMRISLELAKANPVYESMATKFFQHYVYVAGAMKNMGGRDYQLFDDQDNIFYDVLRYPNGEYVKLRVRSLVGLIPLYAVERLEDDWIAPFSQFSNNLHWFMEKRQDLVKDIVHTVKRGGQTTYVLTIMDFNQIQHLVQEHLLNPNGFLSDYGIRSLSKYHERHPFRVGGREVGYEPAEAETKIKGGNSNWRGPIWFPTTFLLIESLRKLGKAFGEDVKISGMTFRDMAGELAGRLVNIFKRDEHGRRPVFGDSRTFQEDPHWRDYLLFYEYFHADHGAGLGASHQTGWTALVAALIHEWPRPQPAVKRDVKARPKARAGR